MLIGPQARRVWMSGIVLFINIWLNYTDHIRTFFVFISLLSTLYFLYFYTGLNSRTFICMDILRDIIIEASLKTTFDTTHIFFQMCHNYLKYVFMFLPKYLENISKKPAQCERTRNRGFRTNL